MMDAALSFRLSRALVLAQTLCAVCLSFQYPTTVSRTSTGRTAVMSMRKTQLFATDAAVVEKSEGELLREQKKKLFGMLQTEPIVDPVLADPITKGPIKIRTRSTLLGGKRGSGVNVKFYVESDSNVYSGSSDGYIDLLEPSYSSSFGGDNDNKGSDDGVNKALRDSLVRNLVPFVPVPLRNAVTSLTGTDVGTDYVLMRDLFTSPAVSYAYERGWRQNFRAGGFPGPDNEAEMAMEYFDPVMYDANSSGVLVDMSCATGLFTRRFAKSGRYNRVLGCDYSDSMLREARNRIRSSRGLSSSSSLSTTTKLDLVRLDVGQIPMRDDSVDALHAGAAMHCWPDLPAAAKEIYRVLRPGGRYFATTFLSSYFRALRSSGETEPSSQGFQYFGSTDVLRDLLVNEGGFDPDKVSVDVIGSACIVIKCEK